MDDKYSFQDMVHTIEEVLRERHLNSLMTLSGGVAHEFNNLLAAIVGYCQMLQTQGDDPDFRAHALGRCLASAAKGSEIVKQLLHFSGICDSEWQTGDARSIIADVADIVSRDAEHLGIRLETTFGEIPPIHFDASMLSAALLDLLQNAIEAVSDMPHNQRTITLTTRQEDADAVIRIRDSGPGFTADELMNATTPFYTNHGPLAHGSRPGAKGLGLASALGLIRKLGGELTLDSPLDAGAEVRVAFPPARPLFDSKKGHILIVDDEAAIRRIFDRFLVKAGYNTTCVETAGQALEALKDHDFDMVLLDYLMPKMSGMELLRHLQENPPHPKVPVVMITAGYSPEVAREALSLGASACVAKPINRQKVLYLVDSFTGAAHQPIPTTQTLDQAICNGKRVLIVDSEPLSGEVMELILSRAGYRCRRVESGSSAVEATENEYYDLILMDMYLHDQPGKTVVHSIRINNPYTPILVTTAGLSRKTLNEAYEAGATRAIQKPIHLESILREVDQIVTIFQEIDHPAE